MRAAPSPRPRRVEEQRLVREPGERGALDRADLDVGRAEVRRRTSRRGCPRRLSRSRCSGMGMRCSSCRVVTIRSAPAVGLRGWPHRRRLKPQLGQDRARVDSPGCCGAARASSVGVRGEAGRGRRLGNAVALEEAVRGRGCAGWSGASSGDSTGRDAGVGAVEDARTTRRACASRNTAANCSLSAGPVRGIVAVGERVGDRGRARRGTRRRTGARSRRPPSTRRRRSRRPRRTARRCRAGWCRAGPRSRTRARAKNGVSISAAPSIIAASIDLPASGALALEQRGDDPEREQHPAAREVAERR